MICLPYEFRTCIVLSLCPSSKLFPRWFSNLCVQNLLHMFWAQAHRTGLSASCMRRQQDASPSSLSKKSHGPLHTIVQSQQKEEKNTNSDLILLGTVILVHHTLSDWALKRKNLQPSFSCYFCLCWTCPTTLWWGWKLSCHRTPSLHVREHEKTA